MWPRSNNTIFYIKAGTREPPYHARLQHTTAWHTLTHSEPPWLAHTKPPCQNIPHLYTNMGKNSLHELYVLTRIIAILVNLHFPKKINMRAILSKCTMSKCVNLIRLQKLFMVCGSEFLRMNTENNFIAFAVVLRPEKVLPWTT